MCGGGGGGAGCGTLELGCGFAALAYAPFFVKLGVAMLTQGPVKYNNVMPRETKWEEVMSDHLDRAKFIERCSAAHANGLEALLGFSSAMLLAKVNGVPDSAVKPLGNTFLGLRVLYNLAYLGGVNTPVAYIRTACFLTGQYVQLHIFALAAVSKKA